MFQYDNGGYQREKPHSHGQLAQLPHGRVEDAYYHTRGPASKGNINRYNYPHSRTTSSSLSKSYDNDSVFDNPDQNHNPSHAAGNNTMQHYTSTSSAIPGRASGNYRTSRSSGYPPTPPTRELSPTSTRYIKGEREIPPAGESPARGFSINGYPRYINNPRATPSYELQRITPGRAAVGVNPDILEGSRGILVDRDRDDGDQSTLSSGRDPNKSMSSREELDVNRNISSSRDQSPDYKARWGDNHLRQRSSGSADPVRSSGLSLHSPRDGTTQSVLSSSGSNVNEDANTRSLLAQKSLTDTNPDLSRLDPNRSIMSGEYRVNRPASSGHLATLYSSSIQDPNRSAGSKDYYQDQSGTGSLKRDPVTHRIIPVHQQNGIARPLRDIAGTTSSRRSLSSSHYSLTRHPSRLTLYGRGFGIYNSLASLALLALLSLLLVAISLQMVFGLNSRDANGLPDPNDSVLTDDSYFHVREVCTGLSTFVVMLNVCCILVCSLQFFLAAKLLKCPQGNERAFKYLKDCTGTRFIVVVGFFVSIPALLLALLLYMLLEFQSTPAIIGTVIFTIGFTFCLVAVIHTAYFWQMEKNKADLNIPPYENKTPPPESSCDAPEVPMSHSELSTLV